MSAAAQCRDCGAPIFWANSRNGKAMAMDAEPVSESTPKCYVLLDDGEDENPQAVFSRVGLFSGEHHYSCHFDTCEARQQQGSR